MRLLDSLSLLSRSLEEYMRGGFIGGQTWIARSPYERRPAGQASRTMTIGEVMKIKILLVLIMLFMTMFYAQEPEDTEQPAEEQMMRLKFKDINVFEYDLDVLFETDEGETMWFSHYNIELSEYDLYTIEDHDGFPQYHVNEEKVGKQYIVTYIEDEIEGEFSGELELTRIITGLEEVEVSEDGLE